jgi:FtsZ-binding cell division protein ZapB
MCRLEDAIHKLENGSDVKDIIDAIEVLALEMNDLKEIRYAGTTPMPTRSGLGVS